MKRIVNSIVKYIKNSNIVKNTSWIFFGNIGYSILNFIMGLYVARTLPLNISGEITYIASLISVVSCFTGLGFGSIISKKFAEHKNYGDYLFSCILFQTIISTIGSIILQIYATINSIDSLYYGTIVLTSSLSMVLGAIGLIVYWYRYNNRANYVAKVRIIAFIISAILRIISLSVIKNINLYLISGLSESILFNGLLLIGYKKDYKNSRKFSIGIVWEVLKESYPFIFDAIMLNIFTHIDALMLENMLGSEHVALYGASTRIATLISTIPSTLIEGFRPEIMRNKAEGSSMYEKRFRQLYCIMFWTSIAYGFVITLFPKLIITILYGEKYIGAVKSLPIVVWYNAFSFFGSINNMYMVVNNKSKWTQLCTFSGAVVKILFNLLLIPNFGISGAAIASVLTQTVANIIIPIIIPSLHGCVKLMIDGILFKNIH